MSYSYPIDETWSQQEIVDVVNFFNLIEQAYENQVRRDDIIALYRRFKEIVPSKSEEKQLFATFTKASGYAPYPVVKQARNPEVKNIRM
ncbi:MULTISPECIES: UPF0223 family protein [Oceanobacillus]|uniref:UPF0223 protein GCM10007971_20360 n=1 Tax=Oceanobacillus indicireducens TaxID=1004261 RepID=A0A917XY69_9BACI|nr:UPF0223 family protein [Oceanobacillus indicireducens]GGN58378.1 UPF0223 protein YktA [Oceanobacillus indicireducens]